MNTSYKISFNKKLLIAISIAITVLGCIVMASCANQNQYQNQDMWMYYEQNGDKPADTFLVAPCVDVSTEAKNTDIKDETIRKKMKFAIDMEKGIYDTNTNIYAPYYKQWSIPVLYMDVNGDGKQYVDTAYNDVKESFEYYLSKCNTEKPLVLAGFSEGSQMLLKLMKEYKDNDKVKNRLVASYCIGWQVNDEDLKDLGQIKMAQTETDTNCIVAFSSEAEDVTSSPFVKENEHTYAINPLNWKTDSTPADKSLSKGGVFFDDQAKITVKNFSFDHAYLDSKRGTLKVCGVDNNAFSTALFSKGVFHLCDYQFFFNNLKDNVSTRLNNFQSQNG